MYMNASIQISKLKLNNTDNFTIIKVHEFFTIKPALFFVSNDSHLLQSFSSLFY